MVLNKTFSYVQFGEKMENKNLNLKKSLICTLLVAVVFFGMATSLAYARETAPPQTPPDNTAITTDDNPVLIANQDKSTPPPEENSVISTQDTELNDNPILISGQSKTDYTAFTVGVAALVAAIAIVIAVFVTLRRRRTSP